MLCVRSSLPHKPDLVRHEKLMAYTLGKRGRAGAPGRAERVFVGRRAYSVPGLACRRELHHNKRRVVWSREEGWHSLWVHVT